MKALFLTFAAFILLLLIAACSAASDAPTSTPVIIVVTATFTSTLEATATPEHTATPVPTATPVSTPTPEGLTGTLPQNWKEVKLQGTDASFALPSDAKIIETRPGFVRFDMGSPESFQGYVIMQEEVPATKLSLLRMMPENLPLLDVFFNDTLFRASLVEEGQLEDPPLQWGVYEGGYRTAVAAVVTTKGTILIALGRSTIEPRSAWTEQLIEIANTLSFPASVIKIE